MSDDRFGDRVSVSDLSDEPINGGLAHPNDPWASASESVDSPFTAQAFTPRGTQGTQEQPKPLAKVEVPVGQRPVPQVARVSRKESETLKKFRETFGLKRVSQEEAILERRDPNNPDRNVQMKFGLRGVNHEDYQWILTKTQELLQNPKLATFAWKISFISMGVCSIDGIPVWEVLGFVPSEAEHTRDPMYPHMGLRFQAADAFCEELRTSLFEIVEELYAAYEAKVDSKYLAKKETSKTSEDKEEEAGEAQGPLPLHGSEK